VLAFADDKIVGATDGMVSSAFAFGNGSYLTPLTEVRISAENKFLAPVMPRRILRTWDECGGLGRG
jgi:hypothetical protein